MKKYPQVPEKNMRALEKGKLWNKFDRRKNIFTNEIIFNFIEPAKHSRGSPHQCKQTHKFCL